LHQHLTGYGHMCGEVLFSSPLLCALLIQKVRAKHSGKENHKSSFHDRLLIMWKPMRLLGVHSEDAIIIGDLMEANIVGGIESGMVISFDTALRTYDFAPRPVVASLFSRPFGHRFTMSMGIFESLCITPYVTLPSMAALRALLPWEPITIRSAFDFIASFTISSTGLPFLIAALY